MPTLTVTDHLEGLRAALVPFADVVDRLPRRTTVPSCPDWTLGRLVAHQGMVHRWAAGHLTGAPIDAKKVQNQGGSAEDQGEWLRDGAIEFVTAVTQSADDVEAMTFWEVDSAKAFWARRQCHETTIHAADAEITRKGRLVVAEDLPWLTAQVAVDAIAELLNHMILRERVQEQVTADEETRLLVAPTDTDLRWLVVVGPDGVGSRPADDSVDADVSIEGTPQGTLLTLYNRGDDAGRGDLGFWRENVRI